ncbi:MAG: cytochrome c3 family protein [Acidobacteriota bacterium]
MPQIFHRSSNVVSKLSLILAVILLSVGLWAAYVIWDSPYFNRVGVIREQPVQFSHKHHVGDDGIDCRYCHTSVETSAFAGIPSTHICMSCHSQLWSDSPYLQPVRESWANNKPIEWVRVHDLPDFVYFNHSIHVNKGVACIMCHGRVDEMPLVRREKSLQMQWCLSCHRSPELFVRPREHVFDMTWRPTEDQLTMGRRLVKEYRIQKLTDCYTCHR